MKVLGLLLLLGCFVFLSCQKNECILCPSDTAWPEGVLCKESYQTAGNSGVMPWADYRNLALENGCAIVE